MSTTKINVNGVRGLSSTASKAKGKISSAKSSFERKKNSVDGKIQNRANIRSRMDSLNTRMNEVEYKIGRIDATVQGCANKYSTTELKVNQLGDNVKNNISKKNASKSSAYWTSFFDGKKDEIKEKKATDSFATSKPNKSKATKDLIGKLLKAEKTGLSALSKLLKNNKTDANELGFSSSILSYISGLYTFCTTKNTSTSDVVSSCLGLTKDSASAWTGLYKYYDKKLSPLQASRLGKKYQTSAGVISIVGSVCGFTKDAIKTYKTLTDDNVGGGKKVAQIMDLGNSGTGVARSVTTFSLGKKQLTRTVTAKYKWDVSATNKTKLAKANTIVSLVGVGFSTISGGAERYDAVAADGFVDAGDIGEIGINGSVKGLTSIINTATFGLSDAVFDLSGKSGAISDGIVNFAENQGAEYVRNHEYSLNYVKNAQFLMDYANDPNNNGFMRTAASATAGLGMIGAITVDAVCDVGSAIGDAACAVGDWVSTGWKNIFG